MVLLAVLGVTGKEELVIVEVSELAVEQTVTLQLLSRRENAATFGALIDEKRSHKFPWFEDIHHLTDELIVGCLGEVGFKADVRELWLGGDMNRPVSSISLHSVHRVSTRVEHCGIDH